MDVVYFLLGLMIISWNNQIGCSARSLETENIVGGNIAPLQAFPYMVKIMRYFRDESGICGGAILDDRHIVTAAHCVVVNNNVLPINLSVIAGSWNKKSPYTVTVYVEKFYVPIKYNSDDDLLTSDIALLKLKSDIGIQNNPFVKSINLPAPLSYEGEKAVISGFGVNNVITKELDGYTQLQYKNDKNNPLKYGQTRVSEQYMCRRIFPFLDSSHFCARMVQRPNFAPEGACRGDSGGPLVLMYSTLIGVHIMGSSDCNESRMPGIYTDVVMFNNFLKNAIQDNFDPDTMVAYHHDPTLGFVLTDSR